MSAIDMTPEIKELEDGRVGYFYSPQQLEALSMESWMADYASRYDRPTEPLAQPVKEITR